VKRRRNKDIAKASYGQRIRQTLILSFSRIIAGRVVKTFSHYVQQAGYFSIPFAVAEKLVADMNCSISR
jgi:hypothetical protein